MLLNLLARSMPQLFTTALQNVATLRANNGGQTRHAIRVVKCGKSNREPSRKWTDHGCRYCRKSSNLAKQQVLVQAAASLTAQANVSNDVALMLLR